MVGALHIGATVDDAMQSEVLHRGALSHLDNTLQLVKATKPDTQSAPLAETYWCFRHGCWQISSATQLLHCRPQPLAASPGDLEGASPVRRALAVIEV